MDSLQDELWIPFSPTTIKDWSLWTKHPAYKNNIIARTLHIGSELNINFNFHSRKELSIQGGSVPLINILKDSYPKASHTLKRRNLLYLSQVVNEDGTHLLPRKLIAHRWQYRHGCQPFWLSYLESTILKQLNSRRLLDEWLVDPDTVPSEEPNSIDICPSTNRT